MFTKFTGSGMTAIYATHVNVISGRCPACRHKVTFEPFEKDHDVNAVLRDETAGGRGSESVFFLRRVCPDRGCRCVVFIAKTATGIHFYPPATLEIDVTALPPSVAAAYQEAVACHAARCFVAAAMLVRKTLEELCVAQGVTTGNLRDKIQALGAKITVPQALLAGVDNLRLLGNDAAHVNANAFNQVGQDEVEAAIGVARELLRATYQMDDVVQRLAALRR